jgi:class 3 adenylate cyclase
MAERAVAVQNRMPERNADSPEDKRIEFRVGIHQGDVIVDDGDIFGDGVNVAARLEALAEPGGICVSAASRRTPPASSTSNSRIWASEASRTSPDPSASIACEARVPTLSR